MSELGQSLAAALGDRIRIARTMAGLRQADVADCAGVSPTMVCRMELGRGTSISLGSWAAVAASVGVDIAAGVLAVAIVIDPRWIGVSPAQPSSAWARSRRPRYPG